MTDTSNRWCGVELGTKFFWKHLRAIVSFYVVVLIVLLYVEWRILKSFGHSDAAMTWWVSASALYLTALWIFSTPIYDHYIHDRRLKRTE
jgi:hypothetical protein